jgi:hypothetical protein
MGLYVHILQLNILRWFGNSCVLCQLLGEFNCALYRPSIIHTLRKGLGILEDLLTAADAKNYPGNKYGTRSVCNLF